MLPDPTESLWDPDPMDPWFLRDLKSPVYDLPVPFVYVLAVPNRVSYLGGALYVFETTDSLGCVSKFATYSSILESNFGSSGFLFGSPESAYGGLNNYL